MLCVVDAILPVTAEFIVQSNLRIGEYELLKQMRDQVNKSQSGPDLSNLKQRVFKHFGIDLITCKSFIKLGFRREQFVIDSFCFRLHIVEKQPGLC